MSFADRIRHSVFQKNILELDLKRIPPVDLFFKVVERVESILFQKENHICDLDGVVLIIAGALYSVIAIVVRAVRKCLLIWLKIFD